MKFVLFAVLMLTNVYIAQAEVDAPNIIDELNPFDPNIEQTLQQLDENYEEETGIASHIDDGFFDSRLGLLSSGCERWACQVYAKVVRSEQKLYLFFNGSLTATWAVSTGVRGHGTPNFDRHPDGRIYNAYTSTKYPGGNWRGLGNMPYAVFISGGFAIHGTPQSNWPKLGRRASHGCIRVHPDNGYTFNRMVRAAGVRNVWITVEESYSSPVSGPR